MSHIGELSKSRATLDIIIFLHKKGETKLTGLIGNVAGQRAIYSGINQLQKLGLIKERKGEKFPYPRLFSLTDYGKKVAESLIIIEDAVNLSSSFAVHHPQKEDMR